MTPEQAKKLREPFKAEQIGKLPRLTCKACSDAKIAKHCDKHQRTKCQICGNYISTAHIHLDYVGHAGTTDRLLEVDPNWTWEPAAIGPNGEPLATDGGLWIKLTVAGVTRYGFGDGETVKIRIGDAIRNAAMRFGVALDLWAKEDLRPDEPAEPNAELVDKLLSLCDWLGVRQSSEDNIRKHAGDETWLLRQIQTAEENIRRLNTPAENRQPAA